MSSEIAKTLEKAGTTGHVQIGTLDNEGYVSKAIGGYNVVMKRDQIAECRAVTDKIVIQPVTPPANTVLNSDNNQIDFRLTPGFAAQLDHSVLHLQITNGSGSNTLTPAPIMMCFDHYDIIGDAGSGDLLDRVYGGEMFVQTAFLPSERVQVLAPLVNTGTSASPWTGPQSLATSAVQDYYLPLNSSFIDACDEHMADLKSDILIRFYTKAAVNAGTSPNLQLSKCELMFTEQIPSPAIKSELKRVHDGNIWRSQYLVWQKYMPTVTLTKSQANYVDLTNIIGKCLFMIVGIKSSDANAAGASTSWIQIDDTQGGGSIDLVSPSGTGLLMHGTPVTGAHHRQLTPFFHCQTTFFNSNYLYLIPFVPNATRALKTCSTDEGFFFFPGEKYQLVINPASGASITNGNGYLVEMYFAMAWQADLIDGRYKARLA